MTTNFSQTISNSQNTDAAGAAPTPRGGGGTLYQRTRGRVNEIASEVQQLAQEARAEVAANEKHRQEVIAAELQKCYDEVDRLAQNTWHMIGAFEQDRAKQAVADGKARADFLAKNSAEVSKIQSDAHALLRSYGWHN